MRKKKAETDKQLQEKKEEKCIELGTGKKNKHFSHLRGGGDDRKGDSAASVKS